MTHEACSVGVIHASMLRKLGDNRTAHAFSAGIKCYSNLKRGQGYPTVAAACDIDLRICDRDFKICDRLKALRGNEEDFKISTRNQGFSQLTVALKWTQSVNCHSSLRQRLQNMQQAKAYIDGGMKSIPKAPHEAGSFTVNSCVEMRPRWEPSLLWQPATEPSKYATG